MTAPLAPAASERAWVSCSQSPSRGHRGSKPLPASADSCGLTTVHSCHWSTPCPSVCRTRHPGPSHRRRTKRCASADTSRSPATPEKAGTPPAGGLQNGGHHGEKEREEQRVGPQIEMEAGLAQTEPGRTRIHEPVSLGLRPHAQELLLKNPLTQAPSPAWQGQPCRHAARLTQPQHGDRPRPFHPSPASAQGSVPGRFPGGAPYPPRSWRHWAYGGVSGQGG